MATRGQIGMALALPLVVLLFLAGYLSQRSATAATPANDLEALHTGLGVDMASGTLPEGGAATTLDEVGPVNETFLTQLDSLRGVVQDAPGDHEASLELAGLLQDAHLSAEAIEHFERVLGEDPSNRQAWLDLADSYGMQQQWDDVRSAMTRMLATHDGDPSAAYNIGVAYANSGNLDLAREWWTTAKDQQMDGEVSAMAESSLAQITG
jgi:tetratricopeptide (TPR) repeat protein